MVRSIISTLHVLAIKQVIESVSGYCSRHQSLTSQRIWIILQRWAKHESNAIFVNRLIPIYYIKLKSRLSAFLRVTPISPESLHGLTPNLLEMKAVSSGFSKFISKSFHEFLFLTRSASRNNFRPI